MRRGRIDESLDAFEKDFRFTRRLLAARDVLLIDKMIAAASFRTSLLFISDLIRQGGLNDAQIARLADVVTPLSEDERSMAGVIAREYAGLASTIQMPDEGVAATGPFASPAGQTALERAKDQLELHFFKYNATLNAAWAAALENQAASRAPCTRLGGHAPHTLWGARPALTSYFHNPAGKILVMVGRPVFTDFLMAMCDLEGMRNIVGLQLALRNEHVKVDDVAGFVKSASSKFPNPYDNQPLSWAAGERTLGFQPIASRDGRFLPWAI